MRDGGVIAIGVKKEKKKKKGLKRHNTLCNPKQFLFGGNKGGTKMTVAVCCVSDGLVFLLEEQRSHAAHFALLLHEDLKVLVDDGHSQEDSRTRTDRTQEVSHHR